jgi:hypothetical protein
LVGGNVATGAFGPATEQHAKDAVGQHAGTAHACDVYAPPCRPSWTSPPNQSPPPPSCFDTDLPRSSSTPSTATT